MNTFDQITGFVIVSVQCKVLNSGLISHKQPCLVIKVCIIVYAAAQLVCLWYDRLQQTCTLKYFCGIAIAIRN